jgi:hypothetical protein
MIDEQVTDDRKAAISSSRPGGPLDGLAEPVVDRDAGERAARKALRGQVARLEGELSKAIASGFPHIPPQPPHTGAPGTGGARLLSTGELELQRDGLVLRLQQAQALLAARVELQLRSTELLEQMKLEPGRYKFKRLPLADLGQGKCGAWVVKPRRGLLGMLAGWWEVKLSSGCPLASGWSLGVACQAYWREGHIALAVDLWERLRSEATPT